MKLVKNKLTRTKCEVDDCNVTDPHLLHVHHIIHRTELDSSNHPFNCCVLCANHHSLTHSGKLKIIGVFPSTKLGGRQLVYELDGKPNVEGIDGIYIKVEPPRMKIGKK